MNYMKNRFLPAIVLTTITLFLIMTFPVMSLTAQAAITDAEYKALLTNPEFKNVEQSLGAVYKAYLSTF